MSLTFLHFTIEKMIHPETGKEGFELSHWVYSSESPFGAMKCHKGFYDTYEQAENANTKQIIIYRFNKE